MGSLVAEDQRLGVTGWIVDDGWLLGWSEKMTLFCSLVGLGERVMAGVVLG